MRMSPSVLQAFSEELTHLYLDKTAGFMSDVGNNIKNTASTMVKDPVGGAKRGWKESFGHPFATVFDKKTGKHYHMSQSSWLAAAKKEPGRFHQLSKLHRAGQLGSAALLIGGAAVDLPGVLKKEDPTGEGRSRVQRAGGFLGNQIGGLIGTPFGMSGALAGSIGGSVIGSQVGKAIDKVRGYKKPQPLVAQSPAEATPHSSQSVMPDQMQQHANYTQGVA